MTNVYSVTGKNDVQRFVWDTRETLNMNNNTLVSPLPAPKTGYGDVWEEVIETFPISKFREVCEERREFGVKKYGQGLQYSDGRDALVDLFQELLDGIVYARKAVKEEKLDVAVYFNILNLAIVVHEKILTRDQLE